VLNDWLIQRASCDVFVREPAAYLHNPSGGLGRPRHGIGNLAQMDGLGLNYTNDHPDPIRQALEVEVRMKRLELGEDLRV
jgi:hypothetical protein